MRPIHPTGQHGHLGRVGGDRAALGAEKLWQAPDDPTNLRPLPGAMLLRDLMEGAWGHVDDLCGLDEPASNRVEFR